MKYQHQEGSTRSIHFLLQKTEWNGREKEESETDESEVRRMESKKGSKKSRKHFHRRRAALRGFCFATRCTSRELKRLRFKVD